MKFGVFILFALLFSACSDTQLPDGTQCTPFGEVRTVVLFSGGDVVRRWEDACVTAGAGSGGNTSPIGCVKLYTADGNFTVCGTFVIGPPSAEHEASLRGPK